jgi:hypothetical protein
LGSGDIAPCTLDLGTRWRWVVNFTPRPLYPREKAPCTHWIGSFVVPQSRSGHGAEEKNSQPLPTLEPPIIQPVAQRYTTELPRLLGQNNVYIINNFLSRAYNSFSCKTYLSASICSSSKNICPPLAYVGGSLTFRIRLQFVSKDEQVDKEDRDLCSTN